MSEQEPKPSPHKIQGTAGGLSPLLVPKASGGRQPKPKPRPSGK